MVGQVGQVIQVGLVVQGLYLEVAVVEVARMKPMMTAMSKTRSKMMTTTTVAAEVAVVMTKSTTTVKTTTTKMIEPTMAAAGSSQYRRQTWLATIAAIASTLVRASAITCRYAARRL